MRQNPSQKITKYASKFFLVICSIVLIAAACDPQNLNAIKKDIVQPNPAPSITITPTSVNSDFAQTSKIKFSGKITNIKNELPYDGNFIVELSGKQIILTIGGLPPNRLDAPRGSIIGLDENEPNLSIYVGKNAEFYGEKNDFDKTSYTIYGDTSYYFKILEN